MATTTTMRTDTVRTYNASDRKSIYAWVIGALILAALIIFFSMDRTRNADTVTTPAAMTAPATVESSAVGVDTSTGTGTTTDTGNTDTDVSGGGAIDTGVQYNNDGTTTTETPAIAE